MVVWDFLHQQYHGSNCRFDDFLISQTPTNHPTTLRIYGALQKFLVKKSWWGISTYQTSGGLSSLAPLHNSTGAPLPTGYEEHHGMIRKRGGKRAGSWGIVVVEVEGLVIVEEKELEKWWDQVRSVWKHRKLPVVMELLGVFFWLILDDLKRFYVWSIVMLTSQLAHLPRLVLDVGAEMNFQIKVHP